MQSFMLPLIFIPLLIALLLPLNSVRVRNTVTYLGTLFLTIFSLGVFFEQNIITFSFSHLLHNIFIFLDIVLLLFFSYVGLKNKNRYVLYLALVQMLLFGYFLIHTGGNVSSDIVVDDISKVMLLVVNIVGSVIIIYSLKYMENEDMKQCKKNAFTGLLFFFVSVMNLIVTVNNIELFFLAFELTTLCSYLLIRYRNDEVAVNNALRALWMNQIGGVAILIALIIAVKVYDTIYFDIFLSNVDQGFLAVVSFLVIASFVKGASIPFNSWLLGAMVAPTPVSAILHSATMVKIAPYLILKISTAFNETVSLLVMFFGSFVFMAASIMALNKDYFKEILGLSTIALLALMMAVAAVGTQEAVNIALLLIVFHAISKALLFLQAGVLEKEFGYKYLTDINHMVSHSKLSVFFILIGFASLTLPPFGAFIGKYAFIELIASNIQNNILYLFVLVFVLLGSVFLTVLYFKVLTKFLTQNRDINKNTTISLNYKLTSGSLVFLLFYGILQTYYLGYLSLFQTLIPVFIIGVSMFLLYFNNFKNIPVIKEYNCGEKDKIALNLYYFNIDEKYQKIITLTSVYLILIIIAAGLR